MAGENDYVIIKRVVKGHGDGHHGGQWKVAYADFVTAMMAFFLLLWLLNATTEEQMAGLANYFSPTALSYTSSGAGGILGGSSMLSPGPMSTSRSEAGVTVSLIPLNPNETPDTDGVPAEKTLTENELEESGIPNAFEEPYESNLRDDEAAENSQIDADDLDDTASQELLERLEQ